MSIIDILSLPLSLPISPIWDFIICLVIGEIAYRVAFSYAGELGTTGGERSFLHWIIRIIVYFVVWSLVCCIILAVRFIKANWVWVIIVLGALAVIELIVLIIRKKRLKR